MIQLIIVFLIGLVLGWFIAALDPRAPQKQSVKFLRNNLRKYYE